MRFTDFKLKISGDWDKDHAKFESFNQHLATIPLRLRLDANNLWSHDIDSAISYFQKVSHPLLGIEEPFSTANFEGMKKLQEHCSIPIILDESGANQAQLKQAHALGIDCILNIKISKAGGVIRSLALIDTAKELGIPIIIGAHVGETSILTRAAMLIASYTAKSLVAIEGGFGELLIERDQVEPVLQLGVGGSIKLADLRCDAIGWGLRQRI